MPNSDLGAMWCKSIVALQRSPNNRFADCIGVISIRGSLGRKAGYTRMPLPRTSNMLNLKKTLIQKKRVDWFPVKAYLHFDLPLQRPDAEALVTDPSAICRHAFLPLISFDRRVRRFKRNKKEKPNIIYKIRQLAYCSNKDTYIFAYYASLLDKKYEKFLVDNKISDVVIGYRKLGSNIDLAKSAFNEISMRKNCFALAFDISKFFDRIDHKTLKRNWCRVLGVDRLPEDHFTVFSRLTKFSTVNRQALLRRLGYPPNSRDRDIKKRPICSITQFRNLIRGDDGVSVNLVRQWKRDYRIPQGTPISALAANIAMIDFDIRMRESVSDLDGSYRRYSDDILIIVPVSEKDAAHKILESCLKENSPNLKINDKKTEMLEFSDGTVAADCKKSGCSIWDLFLMGGGF